MRAGSLRHKIIIQSKTLVSDGMGSDIETWSTFATVWAGIWPVSGKERIKNQQLQGAITTTIRIRYLSGIVESMRILFGDRVFEISAPPINTSERGVMLDLLCTELT